MSIITTIQSTDLITNSRADINNNFSNLNTDKIETSVIDTDTTLSANSNSKLPSQKAVKAYVDAQTLTSATFAITSSATPSYVTTATQRLTLFVKGNVAVPGTYSPQTITTLMKLNGATIDTCVVSLNTNDGNTQQASVSFLYSALPGAQTNNITFDQTISNLKIVSIIY